MLQLLSPLHKRMRMSNWDVILSLDANEASAYVQSCNFPELSFMYRRPFAFFLNPLIASITMATWLGPKFFQSLVQPCCKHMHLLNECESFLRETNVFVENHGNLSSCLVRLTQRSSDAEKVGLARLVMTLFVCQRTRIHHIFMALIQTYSMSYLTSFGTHRLRRLNCRRLRFLSVRSEYSHDIASIKKGQRLLSPWSYPLSGVALSSRSSSPKHRPAHTKACRVSTIHLRWHWTSDGQTLLDGDRHRV